MAWKTALGRLLGRKFTFLKDILATLVLVTETELRFLGWMEEENSILNNSVEAILQWVQTSALFGNRGH